MVTDYGNVYRCIKAVTTPYLDPSKTYTNWELNEVRNNTTLVIGTGQPFPNLETAWTYALNCRVAQGVYLHLSISTAKGDYNDTFRVPFSLDHGSGGSISIIGDTAANINLSFPAGNAFSIDNGHIFNTLSNLTIIQPDMSSFDGVFAKQNSTIAMVSGIAFNNVGAPIFADSGANITVASSCQYSGFATVVVWAQYGATVTATDLNASAQTGYQLTYVPCLAASFGARINAEGATISYFNSGACAYEGGIVDVSNATIKGCHFGATVNTKGHVCAANGTLTNNDVEDLNASTGGTVDASGATYFRKSQGGSGDGSYVYT